MAEIWPREAVEAAVADYLDMLLQELLGISYNKAEHNRKLQKMTGRSRGAIEFKHRNITAVLIELEYPNIAGYKPLFNYQDILRVVVENQWAASKQLQKAALKAVVKQIPTPPAVKDILSMLVPPPSHEGKKPTTSKAPRIGRKLPPRNYLEIEARNRSIGLAGEELVIEFERKRLWRAGKKKLANRIEHVAKTKGDYLGFDIMSFEINGSDRLIEVKTTQFGAWTPFFASRNEVNVSEFHQKHYHLYRLFNFAKEAKMFTLHGSLTRTCKLDPVQFSAIPKL